MPAGVDELCEEFRGRRDGRDCVFNVVINVAEARGLKGLGSTGLNECVAKVYGLWDPEGCEESKIHTKTSTPFFEYVAKLTYNGQPRCFFESVLVVEIQHDRGLMPRKLVGQLQVGIIDIFHSRDHKIPMQWFAISDIYSEEPAVPTGYIRCSLIINSQDEPGAVQPDVPEEERARCELMEIPRIHTSVTATGVYNIIFKVYQSLNLKTDTQGWVDPYIKIITCTGENQTDVKHDANAVWNQQLQIPIYEPHFRQMIEVQLWNQGVAFGGDTKVAHFCLSWKDIFSQQEYFNKPRWYDMYALKEKPGLAGFVEKTGDVIKSGTRLVNKYVIRNKQWVNAAVNAASKLKWGSGNYEEATDYCGRILMSVEIEDREGSKAPPSLATTDMKPKDCDLFKDIKQKMFFRFQVFTAQGLHASRAQVTLTIGRKTMSSKHVARSNGKFEFEFFEAMEMEDDYAYDDKIWTWHDTDYENGYFPSDLIDCAVPVCWLNVYSCDPGADLIGVGDFVGKKLVGFKRMTLRELLNIDSRSSVNRAMRSAGAPSSTVKLQ